MKSRRVGTISMAIVLIAFGVMIFIAQFSQLSSVDLAIKFWPSILILIGGEILWYSYKNKKAEEEVAIKYDVFSIFIVMVILFVNIVVYGLVETGAMAVLKSRISSRTFSYELPFEEHVVEGHIKKIIIDGPRYSGFTIRTVKGNTIATSGLINITAENEESAKETLNQNYISLNQSGDTLFVRFKEKVDFNYYNLRELNLTIPDDKIVEISGGNDLNLIVDELSNNLVVDNIDRVKVRVNGDANIKLEATVYNEEYLRGNVKWDKEQIGEEYSNLYKGELTLGNGENSVNILNSHEITADQI